MPCFRPLKGYRSRIVNPKTGKRSIVFNVKDAFVDLPVDLPCNRCIGCRLERSRQWAIRCVHEAKLYDDNCFITLTYNEENVPKEGLVKKDFQDFMKRLRDRVGYGRVRYYYCGEYGEKFSRPHFHACLFNYDFPDRKFFKKRRGVRLDRSALLEDLWGFGFSTVGNVTFESAAYVARYITKKITGKNAEAYYEGRVPEFTNMSNRRGIGHDWLKKNFAEVYPDDFVVIRGKKMKAPKYYDKVFELEDPLEFAKVKARRKVQAAENEEAPYRLAVKERCAELGFKQLKRGYEDGTESF